MEIDGQHIENGSHNLAVDLVKRAGIVGHVKLVVKRYKGIIFICTLQIKFSFTYFYLFRRSLSSSLFFIC